MYEEDICILPTITKSISSSYQGRMLSKYKIFVVKDD